MPITTPRLLRNEHGVFYFRIILPQDLPTRFGRRSIKRSLHTKDPCVARIIALRINNYFETMRAKYGTQGMSDSIKRLIEAGLIHELIVTEPDGRRFDINTPADEIAYLRIREREAAMRASSRLDPAETGAIGALPMPGAPLLQSQAAASPSADEGQEGIADGLAPRLRLQELRPSYEAWLTSDAPKDRKAKLQTFDHFHAYLMRSRGQAIEQSMQVTATPPFVHLHSIRPAEVVGFFEDYAKRTSRRGGEGLSEATLSAVRARLKNFYEFCISEGFLTSNPVESSEVQINLKRKVKAKAKEALPYLAFSAAELQRIFDPKPYFLYTHARADLFWSPLIAAYSGARLGEIVTLPMSAIQQDEQTGIWHFSVRSENAKNRNSVRQVPICNQLVELGFIEYLEHLRSLGATRLFPHRKEIRRDEGKQSSKRVGEDFSGYLYTRGFRITVETTDPQAPHRKQTAEVKDPQKTFHSFRHTVFTALHVNGVTLADAEMIAGHNDQSIAIQQSLSRGFQVTLSKSTQQEYVNAGIEVDPRTRVIARLKGHLDEKLPYRFAVEQLRHCAQVVNSLLMCDTGGQRFTSGWHGNSEKAVRAALDEARLRAYP